MKENVKPSSRSNADPGHEKVQGHGCPRVRRRAVAAFIGYASVQAEHEGGGNGRSVATLRSVKGSVFKLKNITAGYTRVKASGRHVGVVCCVVFIRLLINSLFK